MRRGEIFGMKRSSFQIWNFRKYDTEPVILGFTVRQILCILLSMMHLSFKITIRADAPLSGPWPAPPKRVEPCAAAYFRFGFVLTQIDTFNKMSPIKARPGQGRAVTEAASQGPYLRIKCFSTRPCGASHTKELSYFLSSLPSPDQGLRPKDAPSALDLRP